MSNEKRLIDANEIEDLFYKQVEYGATDLMDAFDDALQDAQTVYAVEVVHGRCDWCNGDYHTKIMATAIRYHSNGNMDGYEMKVNYCPNCGAKMDGGNEDG